MSYLLSAEKTAWSMIMLVITYVSAAPTRDCALLEDGGFLLNLCMTCITRH